MGIQAGQGPNCKFFKGLNLRKFLKTLSINLSKTRMFSTISLPPRVIEAIAKQLKALSKKSPEGLTLIQNDDDLTDIEADLRGPACTPYQGGLFRIKLELPEDFPKCPPRGYC
jgi:hypothetical protein